METIFEGALPENESGADNSGDTVKPLTETPEQQPEQQLEQQLLQIEELNVKLFDAKTRLALLLSGIAKEKLDEGAALAAGICKTGKSPEEAAAEIAGAYPHLKAVQRDIPQFAASGVCSNDGFSAIRGIFSKR